MKGKLRTGIVVGCLLKGEPFRGPFPARNGKLRTFSCRQALPSSKMHGMRSFMAALITVFLLLPSIASAFPRYECAEHQQVHLKPCPHEHASEGEPEHAPGHHEGCGDHGPSESADPTGASAHGTTGDECCVLTSSDLPSDPLLQTATTSLRSQADGDGMVVAATTDVTLPRLAVACGYESTGPPRGDPVPLFIRHCAFLI